MAHLVVMGVTGCGKSTTGNLLAKKLNAIFLDGDDLHPDSNIEKMRAGIPLNDQDRWPWLIRVGTELASHPNCVIACSALKYEYRNLIRESCSDAIFIHLNGNRETLQSRLQSRSDHFMPVSLLNSQLETLEELRSNETGISINIENSPDQIVDMAIRYISKSA